MVYDNEKARLEGRAFSFMGLNNYIAASLL